MTQTIHTTHHPMGSSEPLLSVRDLRVTFTRHGEPAATLSGIQNALIGLSS
jgi:hypothetical protein